MATKVLVQEPIGTLQVDNSPHDVVATLNYYDDPGDGTPPQPVIIGGGTVTNERKMLQRQVHVSDITGHDGEYTLDKNGFQLVHHESKTSCLDDRYHDLDRIQREYFPECEEILKRVTGASRVFIFDHKVRRGPADWHKLGPNNSSKRGPLHRVHVDQSYEGAEFLVKWYLPEEAEILLKKHWQIINLWRPVNTIFKDPLAVADSTSVSENDLVAAKTVYVDHQRETWTVKPNTEHRWYFKYAQTPEEVMLIKCFDTVTNLARRTPHSAFADAAHEDKGPRESVEIRAMVFYE